MLIRITQAFIASDDLKIHMSPFGRKSIGLVLDELLLEAKTKRKKTSRGCSVYSQLRTTGLNDY